MTEETIQSGESGAGGALRAVSIAGVVVTLGAYFAGGSHVMLGTAIGAAAAVLNLWVITRLVSSFVSGRGRFSWGFIAMIKLVVLFGGMFLLVRSGVAGVFPLLIGYCVLPVGIVAAQLGGLSPAGGES